MGGDPRSSTILNSRSGADPWRLNDFLDRPSDLKRGIPAGQTWPIARDTGSIPVHRATRRPITKKILCHKLHLYRDLRLGYQREPLAHAVWHRACLMMISVNPTPGGQVGRGERRPICQRGRRIPKSTTRVNRLRGEAADRPGGLFLHVENWQVHPQTMPGMMSTSGEFTSSRPTEPT